MENSSDHREMVAAAKVYRKVLREVAAVVRTTTGRELEYHGSWPSRDFEKLVSDLGRILSEQSSRDAVIHEYHIDKEPETQTSSQVIRDIIEIEIDETTITDIDDLAPNLIKEAMSQLAAEIAGAGPPSEIPLDDFLRKTVKKVMLGYSQHRRINIGANRHFHRLLQYVRELEDSTFFSDAERGFWLKNASGRGRVAEVPTHPKNLKLRIDGSCI